MLVRNEKENRTKVRAFLRELSNQNIKLSDIDAVLAYASREGKSIFTQQGLRAMLERELDFAALRASAKELYVCAYDIAGGQPEYFHLSELTNEEVISATLASCAVPYVFPPVQLRAEPMRTAASMPARTPRKTRITRPFPRFCSIIWTLF